MVHCRGKAAEDIEGLNLVQAGRRLVRSLLTICDIGVSSHPWAYVDNK